jgi:acetyl esterase/lipase
MTEHTGFAPSPVPAEPSAESARMVKRMSGNRTLSAKLKPRGFGLAVLRLSTNLFGRAWWSPKGSRPARYGGVPGRQMSTSDTTHGIVLWVHGGAFVSGTPRVDQWLAARYCAAAGLAAFVPRYRLAPKHPFPAAPDDVLAAYRGLLDAGYAARDVRVVGVSAGGALVAGLLGDLGREGLPMPGAVLLLSPLLDLTTATAHRTDTATRDPFVAPEAIERTNLAYADGTPFTHPRLDVLGADMRGWPPILVQTGALECVAGDAELLGARMRAAGAPCEVQLWPGQIHAFMAFPIPEGQSAFAHGARYLADPPVTRRGAA